MRICALCDIPNVFQRLSEGLTWMLGEFDWEEVQEQSNTSQSVGLRAVSITQTNANIV